MESGRMKKMLYALGIICLASLAAFAETRQIVNNNSFETINAEGMPTMWVVDEYFKKDDKMGKIEVVSEAAQDGKICLLIKNGSKQVFHLSGNMLPTTAGDVVRMSLYVKGKGKFRLGIYFRNDKKAWLGADYPKPVEVKNAKWDKKFFSVTIPNRDFNGKGVVAFIEPVIIVDSDSEVFVDNFQGQIEKAPLKEATLGAKE
jgi:hypothetical protein